MFISTWIQIWLNVSGVWDWHTLGLLSLSGKTSYRQISWSLEEARDIGCYNDRIGLEFGRAYRQRCCLGACHVSEPLEHFKTESRSFETSRDLPVRRQSAKWNEAPEQKEWQSQFDLRLNVVLMFKAFHLSIWRIAGVEGTVNDITVTFQHTICINQPRRK